MATLLSKGAILAVLLSLAACNTPKLPDPAANYPACPDKLCEPARKMTPIETGNDN